jgi:hypothetical protein
MEDLRHMFYWNTPRSSPPDFDRRVPTHAPNAATRIKSSRPFADQRPDAALLPLYPEHGAPPWPWPWHRRSVAILLQQSSNLQFLGSPPRHRSRKWRGRTPIPNDSRRSHTHSAQRKTNPQRRHGWRIVPWWHWAPTNMPTRSTEQSETCGWGLTPQRWVGVAVHNEAHLRHQGEIPASNSPVLPAPSVAIPQSHDPRHQGSRPNHLSTPAWRYERFAAAAATIFLIGGGGERGGAPGRNPQTNGNQGRAEARYLSIHAVCWDLAQKWRGATDCSVHASERNAAISVEKNGQSGEEAE